MNQSEFIKGRGRQDQTAGRGSGRRYYLFAALEWQVVLFGDLSGQADSSNHRLGSGFGDDG